MIGISFKAEEMEKYLSDSNFKTLDVSGLDLNPILRNGKDLPNLSVNYIISSKKI